MGRKWKRLKTIIIKKIKNKLNKYCYDTISTDSELLNVLLLSMELNKTGLDINLKLKDCFCIDIRSLSIPDYYKSCFTKKSNIFRLNTNLVCPKLYDFYLDLEQYFRTVKHFSIKTEIIFSKLFGDTLYDEDELIELISE